MCFVEGGGVKIVRPTSFEKKALTEARFASSGAIICAEFYPFSISAAGTSRALGADAEREALEASEVLEKRGRKKKRSERVE